MSRHARRACSLGVLFLVLACGCSRNQERTESITSASAPELLPRAPGPGESGTAAPEPLGSGLQAETQVIPAALDSATAFELVLTFDGATLVWAQAPPEATFRAQRIDTRGGLKGKPELLLSHSANRGRVTDLVAVRLDEGLILEWIEQVGSDARASAAFIDERGHAKRFDLGQAWYTHQNVRGNVALAATRDEALSFVRGRAEACAEGERECFGFRLERLDKSGLTSARGLPLVVPVPCSQHSTGLVIVDGRWHYAVCTLTDDRPVSTVFTIQFEPEYAKAEPYLSGCRPLGLFEYEGDAWLSGDCDGRRRISRVHGGPPLEVDLSGARLVCRARRLLLEAPALTLRLQKPLASLHGFLSAPWVPPGARAVWTGRALLVALRDGERLKLVRYACG